ncbi:MAG: DUF3787 domain-containing protein [Desulfitobacteriaceae bacterium]|nr:DUF3787 domain-containing protein [Desulfitobacteriaceae bacterium]
MSNNKFKEKFQQTPVENHYSAAWANIEKTKSISQVTQPSEIDAEYAKEWVEENQK